MKLDLTDTQLLVQTSAREFATRVIEPQAARIDQEALFPKDILKGLAELGLMGVNIPEALGGSAAGVVAYSLAMTEVARACASTAVTMAVNNMAAEVIARFGSEQQRSAYVPNICSGKYVAAAFALTEPGAGSDPSAMTTTATRAGDDYVLNGAKQWITSASHAGVMIVWARTAPASERPGTRGISCFLVEAGAPGVTIGKPESKLGLRGSDTAPVSFENVHVPATALLGDLHGGFALAMMALDGGRIGIASQAIGIARAAHEAAVRYAKERKQFGKPIAEHQALQWMIADSETEIDAATLLTLRAASLKDQGRPFSQEASMAKLYASEAANRICGRAMQMHGGNGFVTDYPVERHYRDVRVTTIYEGTSEIQRMVIARKALAG